MSGGGDGNPGQPTGGEPPAVSSSSDALGGIDGSRVRSFLGLSIGLVGPRANLAVSGVLITLFVQQRASSALAVTFALTADRLVSWITYPVAGRLSDRTQSRVGRRTPYMAGSLIIMGIATWMFTVVSGYWLLVLMILIAGQASATFTLTNVAVVPEVFGRSRWIKALLLTTVLGTIASLAIKGTVIASWNQHQPSTWNLPFQIAGAILVGVGIAVLVLVREAPTATYGAEVDRKQRARPTRDEIRDILAGPNAKVLVGGSLLFWSGVGSTAYVAILFFQKILHAGASAQTIAGLATGLPVFIIGIALGIPLSRWLTPMQLAIGAPLAGAVLAGVQYFDTHLWQAVVLSYIGAPLVGAYIIVMAPLLLQLLPRAGGLGERIGVLLAPFNLCSVVLAYVAAVVIDTTGNYRLIWLFPAATGLGQALVNCWLKYPAKKASSPDMVGQLWKWSVVQAESLAETGLLTGLLAAPLLGVVTKEDADSAVVIDMARNILGNPYEVDEVDEVYEVYEVYEVDGEDGEDGVGNGDPLALNTPDPKDGSVQSEPVTEGSGGDDGMTGVRQVGGGPDDPRENGDWKSEWGDSPPFGSAGDSTTGGSATGDSATGDSATGDSATGDSATGDSATGDSSTEASATGAPAPEYSSDVDAPSAVDPVTDQSNGAGSTLSTPDGDPDATSEVPGAGVDPDPA